MRYLLYISLCLALFSCKKWQSANDEKPIAKANDSFLYPSDISLENELLPDSISWKSEQIDFWIKKQLWLSEAEKTEGLAEVERRVLDYKESLLVDAYKNELLKNAQLVVTDEMILNYYKEHQNSFILEEELFKLAYFIIENTEENSEIISNAVKGEKSEALMSYLNDHPKDYREESAWLNKSFFEDLGIPSYLWVNSSKFQKYFLESNFVCIYRIDSKKKKGESAPLDEVKGDIKQIIAVQQEKEYLQKIEDELFINAQNKKSFEIY